MGDNTRRWTEEEDALLRTYSATGYTVAAIAEALDRPFGSVATRRRTLGISKDCGTRGPNAPREETPVLDEVSNEMLVMRQYVVLFYCFCLAAAGLLAFLGDV